MKWGIAKFGKKLEGPLNKKDGRAGRKKASLNEAVICIAENGKQN